MCRQEGSVEESSWKPRALHFPFLGGAVLRAPRINFCSLSGFQKTRKDVEVSRQPSTPLTDQASAANDCLPALLGRVTESVWKMLPCAPRDSRARHVSAVGSRGLCDPRESQDLRHRSNPRRLDGILRASSSSARGHTAYSPVRGCVEHSGSQVRVPAFTHHPLQQPQNLVGPGSKLPGRWNVQRRSRTNERTFMCVSGERTASLSQCPPSFSELFAPRLLRPAFPDTFPHLPTAY